ncbi:hypothetical protein IWX90DRAFT_379354 [Phyllosticta citrichinensis]|uniref:ZZ-type domain-containing protein n=1 Tax=Phyllosticta citrichinensis TaxID=1130410 RepID=A0ABR1Y4G8_9PEZI
MASTVPVTMDTLVTIKVSIQGSNRKFKVPMRDLGAAVLPTKLRQLLNIPPNQQVTFERFSDSAGAYITLDPEHPQVYKTLFRAAKAKLKLRLRATALVAGLAPQQQNNTGTIPLYPYARLPAFHKTDMKTSLPSSSSAAERNSEAPVPPPFVPRPCESKIPEDKKEDGIPALFSKLDGIMATALNQQSAIDQKDSSSITTSTWSVYCNQCDSPITNEHFHCSICDEGDYDLCKRCVDAGEHCPVSAHWLVKRFIQNGKVTNSTTERIGPKSKPEDLKMEATFGEAKPLVEIPHTPTRTCNCCVKELPDPNFVHCTECEDYDLCLSCHVGTQHGHHPGHAFEPVIDGPTVGPLAKFLCAAGRNVRHSAVCDGCEDFIYGVRHKCLNCPDWDYCGKCIKNANTTHATHRFVPIYEPLPEPRTFAVRHFGIYCDGPLCKNKDQTYIEGVRYKCAVCDDLDFCASCEAAPGNRHNRTHPLIKFKTPVRKVHVTTASEDKWGKPMPTLGDAPLSRPESAERQRPASNNASTQIRTVVDLKPTTSEEAAFKAATDKIKIKDLLVEPVDRRSKLAEVVKNVSVASIASRAPKHQYGPPDALNAHFIRDTICDGTQLPANCKFLQVWTLRNPGPNTWPAGCSVRYVGGDNMLNVDNETSSNTHNIIEAVESNVINNPVEPGSEVSFSVLMKAPAREGAAISYWRVKAPDGSPFGHRLWCHINVMKPAPVPVESPQSSDSERTLHRLKELRERRQVPELSDSDRNSRRRELIRRSTQLIRERRLEREAAERLELAMSGNDATFEARRKSLKPTVEDAPESEISDSPVKEEPKIVKPVELKTEPAAENSRMVFPTLEKESPESSSYEAASSSQSAKSDKTTVPASEAEAETEIFEDAETVDISSDDGFLTDEEYDVLDASDEEFA